MITKEEMNNYLKEVEDPKFIVSVFKSEINDCNINDSILRRIYFYRQMSLSYFQIAEKLNCSIELVYYICNK